LFQESFGNLKHYRPFCFNRGFSFSSCAKGSFAILLIHAASPNLVGIAFAQPVPSATAPVTIDEANRRAAEALGRKDYATALQWLRKSADQKDARAQLAIGKFFYHGWGVPKNNQEAMVWYRWAADQGDAEAQEWVGKLYNEGSGVRRDSREAMAWFKKAAEQGYASSQGIMCAMYLRGDGVQQDTEQGADWCKKAAEQGYAPAQTTLGILYLEGKAVPKNEEKAAMWLQKAAEQNDALAELWLGKMYQDGVGVPKDSAKARSWLQKASDQGNPEAKKHLAELDNGKHPKTPATVSRAMAGWCTIEAGPQIMYDAMKPGKAQDEWKARYVACLRSEWKRLYGTELPSD
jgi:TPR repeat protein